MRVGDLLQRKRGRAAQAKVVTVGPTTDVGGAVRLLLQHGIGGLPVVDGDGRVLGFVSERDVVEALERYPAGVATVPVTRIMRQPPVCRVGDGMAETMGRMTRERLRHLVVLDEGRVAGILSVGDIVKHRLEELETEAGVLRDYVAAQRATI